MRHREPVWQLLRRRRTHLGLSQYALATRLAEASGNAAVTREEVSRWERGKRIPGPYWRNWLSQVLDLPVSWLSAAARWGRWLRSVRRRWYVRAHERPLGRAFDSPMVTGSRRGATLEHRNARGPRYLVPGVAPPP